VPGFTPDYFLKVKTNNLFDCFLQNAYNCNKNCFGQNLFPEQGVKIASVSAKELR